ncbi:MAG TPA: hypothetical protein VHA33_01570 [Candidatus Angelobacter sp.]|jgi:hypothetical protein|nr:hypothetical protein [Candidatus Angelobacter sp.]
MKHGIETPFESIESAQQFIKLLAEAITDARHDIDHEITLAADRRLQALYIVAYNLEKLQRYLTVTGRTLNDLRSLRRLLFDERRPAHDTSRQEVARAPHA